MPLFSRKKINSDVSILLWDITESESELSEGIQMHPSDVQRFKRFTHENKRKEFLALRRCLIAYFGKNPEVHYTSEGKPSLKNGYYISFSHSRQYAAIIVSQSVEVGIDIELYREGILRIAHKFLREEEHQSILKEDQVAHTTFYWGAKEVMVKITGDRRHNFIQELSVTPFSYQTPAQTIGKISSTNCTKAVELHFEKHDDLYITYGWEKT